MREEDKTEGKDKSREIAVKEKELAAAEEKLTALRAKYSSDPEFKKYEEYKDNGVDLARLASGIRTCIAYRYGDKDYR